MFIANYLNRLGDDIEVVDVLEDENGEITITSPSTTEILQGKEIVEEESQGNGDLSFTNVFQESDQINDLDNIFNQPGNVNLENNVTKYHNTYSDNNMDKNGKNLRPKSNSIPGMDSIDLDNSGSDGIDIKISTTKYSQSRKISTDLANNEKLELNDFDIDNGQSRKISTDLANNEKLELNDFDIDNGFTSDFDKGLLKTEANVSNSISSNTFKVQSKSQNQDQPYQYLHYAQQQDGQYLNHQNQENPQQYYLNNVQQQQQNRSYSNDSIEQQECYNDQKTGTYPIIDKKKTNNK